MGKGGVGIITRDHMGSILCMEAIPIYLKCNLCGYGGSSRFSDGNGCGLE